MATSYGSYAGSGTYWRTYLTYSTANTDNTTTKVSLDAGVNHKAIPSSVASSWGKKHDSGWIKVAGDPVFEWDENDLSGTASVSSAGSFSLKSTSKSFTRSCTAQTKSVQARNYHSNSGNTPKLTGTSTTTSANVTIPARPKYTITFNSNGGTGGSVSLKCSHCDGNHKSYGYNASITGTNPTRAGYTFAGWYTSASGGTRVTTVSANANTTYYAHWNPISYSVRYNKNSSDAVGTMSNTSFVYGTPSYLAANKFYRPGYKFIGWATSPDGPVIYADHALVGNLTTIASAVVQFYAKWESIISNMYVKENGILRKVEKAYIKVNDQWAVVIASYLKDNGAWREK